MPSPPACPEWPSCSCLSWEPRSQPSPHPLAPHRPLRQLPRTPGGPGLCSGLSRGGPGRVRPGACGWAGRTVAQINAAAGAFVASEMVLQVSGSQGRLRRRRRGTPELRSCAEAPQGGLDARAACSLPTHSHPAPPPGPEPRTGHEKARLAGTLRITKAAARRCGALCSALRARSVLTRDLLCLALC